MWRVGFSEEVAQKILLIPLAQHTHEHFLSWRGEASREYSVRSGYKILLQRNENYRQKEINTCYKKLWSCDLPSKINITAWRVTLNFILTLVNLKAKRLINEAICQRCLQGLETREHVFRDCTATKKIWENLEFTWPQTLSQVEFMEWFTWIMLYNTREVSQTFICALWAIWSAKNKWMYENHRRPGAETVRFIRGYIQEVKDIKKTYLALRLESELWRPPKKDFFKINFDAAFDNRQNRSLLLGLTEMVLLKQR